MTPKQFAIKAAREAKRQCNYQLYKPSTRSPSLVDIYSEEFARFQPVNGFFHKTRYKVSSPFPASVFASSFSEARKARTRIQKFTSEDPATITIERRNPTNCHYELI